MSTTLEVKPGNQPDPRKPATDNKAPVSEPTITSQNDLNLIREILVRPTEEINEERIVELVRMLEQQDEAFSKRLQKLEHQVRKLATMVDENQQHAVADIGSAMVSAGQRIMDLQEKLQPAAAATKS